jgi:hypothetical protein
MKVGVIDDGCKAWLLANAPEMAAKFGYAGGEAAAGGEGEGEKAAGGGGKKKKDAGVKEVLVSSKQRQKKKFVCTGTLFYVYYTMYVYTCIQPMNLCVYIHTEIYYYTHTLFVLYSSWA